MHESTASGRRYYVPILPPAVRLPVMQALHDLPMSGHLGYKKTYHRIRTQFLDYWKGMGRDVKAFVRSRLPCQSRKPPQPRHSGQLQLFSASRPFEVVGIDIFGPMPCTQQGNRYVVVMVDRFSRWTELVAVPDITTITVADVVVERLLSDGGPQFLSALFKRLAERLGIGIQKIFTSAYHPQTNGQVERMNIFIAAALTAYVNDHQDDWDNYLEAIAFAYRTSTVDAIGNTPFYLVHGRDPRLPTDVLAGTQRDLDIDAYQYGLSLTQHIKDAYTSAQAHQETADLSRKHAYDSHHHPVHFAEGSLVYLHSPVRKPGLSPKLSKHYDDPYRVLRKLSDVHYELSHLITGKHTKAHVQRLQAVFLPADTHADTDECFHQHRSAAVHLVPDCSDDSETDLDATSSVSPCHLHLNTSSTNQFTMTTHD